MKNLLFVFNPCSGAGKICKHVAEILDVFTKAGYEATAYPTQAAGDGVRIIKEQGESFDRIVVAGGDGMLHELINGVLSLEKEVEVGYIPMGTVNDFAATHRMTKDPVEAAKIAVSDNVKALDVGKFEEEYVSYVAAFGFGAGASYETPQKAKKRWKMLAYIANALKGLRPKRFKAMARKMTVTADNAVLKGEFIFGAVSNSFSIAGFKNLTDKNSEFDDGLLEGLFILRPKKWREWRQVAKGLLSRDFNLPGLLFVRAEKFDIVAEKPTRWSLDGENGGEHEHVTMAVQKRVLKIALPANDGKKEEKKSHKKEEKHTKETK